ncbi:T9SS type A sorting domain-containing protein [Hymenobacter swuensis]|uniref:Secretion system C-terminal sorting domain-containing protein n=1 Tax=Hymenobacter swuensis DY53 TaxID=1227739 RepID=W8EWX6_9BACT|nr:T9SS type A sorting domain-containing protein [Hymenobacter swuensis]AHJ97068.1 hypothetical protein Hsw_1473 [Hymenobacter swuensis DY53]
MPASRTLPVLRFALGIWVLLLAPYVRAQTSFTDPAFPAVKATFTRNSVAQPAIIYDVVRQADGKYIIGGNFTAINGIAASRLARLEPDGTLDAAYTAVCRANGTVTSLALQPDGRLLVGGVFTELGGTERAYLGRLETSGVPDASFTPYTAPPNTGGEGVNKLLVQPDGQVLVCGRLNLRGAGFPEQYLTRLNGKDGHYDPSFQFTLPTPDTSPKTIALQPDGRVLVGGYGPSYRQAILLMRLHPNGTADNTFALVKSSFTSELNALAVDGAGRIYAGGMFNSNGPGNTFLRRYLPDGTLDTSFSYPIGGQTSVIYVQTLAVQPNGRLLVGHMVAERLMANGSLDTSFLSGINGAIQRYLVQPDGAIMVAGSFRAGPGATDAVSLVRVLDTNVLRVHTSVADARTTAWPVPTHDVLHLQLDAASGPQRVQLLDMLGKAIRTIEQPTAALSLPVVGLASGTYQLQIKYAKAGQVSRRIVLE